MPTYRIRASIQSLSLVLFLITTIFSTSSHAQAVYGSINGTVTDSAGAVIPGATVTITSVERNTADTVKTNESGLYVKDRLLPGTYEVKVEQAGFKQVSVPAVIVNVDTATPLNVVLETGEISDVVTITATELLKTDRADVATTFETRQVNELPILDRNLTRLVLLTPGAQQFGFQHASSENPQGSIQTQVNGQHFSGTGYQLDGTDNRDPILGIIVINPNFEAIGETKITSQNYDAEFGQATAGVVSVQTKSGTNELHGSVFAFRQSDELQARNSFSQSQPDSLTGKLIPDSLRNQFGGSIGGPILKDKLFFFGDYQGTRSKIGGTQVVTVPTDLARTGDLSEYGVNIFDPLTGDPSTRTQFAGNIIPADRLSPEALNLLNLLPRPNRPGISNNFAASGSEIFDNDTFDIRIDGRYSEKLNLFGRYSFADFSRDGPSVFGDAGGTQLVSLGGTSAVRNQSIAIGFDYVLSPTTVVDFRFGFFHYKVDVLPFDFGGSASADAGIPGLNLDDNFTSGLSAFSIQGAFGFNFGSGLGINRCNCPLQEDEKQFQFVGNILKTVGNHSLKFGIDVRRAYNLRIPSDQHRSGELFFSPSRTQGPVPPDTNGDGIPDANNDGLGLAAFLLGDVSSFQRFSSESTDARERQWRHYYYVQDTWRATPKLTLNYGLRLDVVNPQTVNEPGNGGFLDLETGEIRVAGVGDNSLNGNVENSLNFAPRLGIAYQITNKTVIRAGYGRSYDIGVFGSLFGHSVTQNLPVLSAQQLNIDSFGSVFNLAEGPPPVVFPTVGEDGNFALPPGVFTRALPEKQRPPTVDAYNITVQHQLTDTITIEAAYVGNKGTHVFAGDSPDFNINEATIVGFGEGPGTAGFVPIDQRKPFFSTFGWTQNINFFCNCADNRYDSLQTKATKRFSQGYSFLAHYTLSRATQENSSQFIYDPELNRGPQTSDRTHSFTFTNLAELPFGRGKRFFSNASRKLDFLVGGWQFNSTTTISSGLPFNVDYVGASADRDTGPNRPNLIDDPQTGGDQHQFFNATPIGTPGSAFGRPAIGTFGDLGFNELRGPNYWRTDASLFKRFIFTETKELEFRIESVNVFNHLNLDIPRGDEALIGNDTAGQIRRNANEGTDPMRNFQFALKFKF